MNEYAAKVRETWLAERRAWEDKQIHRLPEGLRESYIKVREIVAQKPTTN